MCKIWRSPCFPAAALCSLWRIAICSAYPLNFGRGGLSSEFPLLPHTVSHKHPSSIVPYFTGRPHIFGTLKKELSNFFVTLFPATTQTIWVAGNSIPPPRNRVHKRTQLAYNVAPPLHAEGGNGVFWVNLSKRGGAVAMTAIVMQSLTEMPDTSSLTCSNGIGTLCCHNFFFRRRRQRQRVKRFLFNLSPGTQNPTQSDWSHFYSGQADFRRDPLLFFFFLLLRLSPLPPSIPINNGRSHLSLEFLSLSPALFFGWRVASFQILSWPPSLPRLPIENDPQKFKIFWITVCLFAESR